MAPAPAAHDDDEDDGGLGMGLQPGDMAVRGANAAAAAGAASNGFLGGSANGGIGGAGSGGPPTRNSNAFSLEVGSGNGDMAGPGGDKKFLGISRRKAEQIERGEDTPESGRKKKCGFALQCLGGCTLGLQRSPL
jgi:hypothetical protein